MNHKITEHYYTSSKSKGGFFTLDNSPTLTKEELKELEEKCTYKAPYLLPMMPTATETKELFPVEIGFYKLKSGKYVYLKSTYLGNNNQPGDRYGNFFSHSIILTEDEPNFPAALMFEQGNFKDFLTIEEDRNYKPILNDEKIIEINVEDDLCKSLFYAYCGFINSYENRKHFFSKIFDLLCEGKIQQAGYNITISDKKDSLNNWFLLINFLLPQHLANQISFASYVANPKDYSFKLTGIIPECGVSSLDERYFTILDAATNISYQPINDFTQMLLKIVENREYGQWRSFIKYFDRFDINTISSDLNIPAIYNNFITMPEYKSVSKLKEIIPKLSDDNFQELQSYIRSNKIDLYYEWIKNDFTEKYRRYVDLSKRKECFIQCYRKYFESNEILMRTYLNDFFETLFGIVQGDIEKKYIAAVALCNINIKYLSDDMQNALVGWLEKYFENDSDTKKIIEDIGQIVSNMDKLGIKDIWNKVFGKLSNTENALNMHSMNLYIDKLGLMRAMAEHRETFDKIKEKSRQRLLVIGLDSEFKKSKYHCYHKIDFEKYIELIKEFYPNEDSSFWRKYFDGTRDYNGGTNSDYYSIGYLKKLFVADIFLRTHDKYRYIVDVFDYTATSLEWLKEHIDEHSVNPETVKLFADFKLKKLFKR